MNRPKLQRDWVGHLVRLRHQVENGGGDIFEAGEVMRVIGNYQGLKLEQVRRCSECQRRHRTRIDRVPLHKVNIIPRDEVDVEVGGNCPFCIHGTIIDWYDENDSDKILGVRCDDCDFEQEG